MPAKTSTVDQPTGTAAAAGAEGNGHANVELAEADVGSGRVTGPRASTCSARGC